MKRREDDRLKTMWRKYPVIVLLFFTSASLDAAELGKYEYQMDNRPDPFFPFIQSQTGVRPSVNPQQPEGAKNQNPDVPLEPGQIKIVAVIFSRENWTAVAEDVTGRGYFLKVGTTVGSYGVVKKIGIKQVLIEETYTTPRLIVKKIALRLQQEGNR